MKKLLTGLFMLLCFLNSYGQDLQKIDSLKRLLNKSKEDTSKVKLLFALTLEYEDHDMKKAMTYAKEGGRLSNKLNYTAGKLKYNKRMMYLFATLTQHDSAIVYGKQIPQNCYRDEGYFKHGYCIHYFGGTLQFQIGL
ncbi:hypothetical protein [Pedobacter sp. UC225_65]|uniref:hypothetical protein n=1 Tax=Pedobacter sp. UC225_65 TaxID=3350173 RepID=UPI00366B4D5A